MKLNFAQVLTSSDTVEALNLDLETQGPQLQALAETFETMAKDHTRELQRQVKYLLPLVEPGLPERLRTIQDLLEFDSGFFSSLDNMHKCWYARCLIAEAHIRGMVPTTVWLDNKELKC